MSPSLKEQAEAALREPKAPEDLHAVAQTGKPPAKPKRDTLRVNLLLDRAVYRQLKVRAAQEGTTMALLIEQAVSEVYGFEG